MDPIWEKANPQLRDLTAYEPGKPIEETARERGRSPSEIIKLASNENPLGPSPRAVEAMRAAAAEANFYPDGGGFALRTALAEKLEVSRESIILGNGSNEIIEFIGHAFLRPGAEMVTSENAFIAYRLAASLFGARTRRPAASFASVRMRRTVSAISCTVPAEAGGCNARRWCLVGASSFRCLVSSIKTG